jgi:hypothetical protein
MKIRWTLAALLAAGLVFAVTFATMYRGSGHGQARSDEYLRLSFPRPLYPPGDKPVVSEYGRPGSCVFWFYNPHDRDVQIGGARKSCKCSDVRVQIVPREILPTFYGCKIGLAGAVSAAGTLLPPAATGLALSAAQEDWAAEQLRSLGQAVEVSDEHAALVPAHALGAVHVTWKTEKIETRVMSVWMWTDSKANENAAKLDVSTTIVPPLEVPVDSHVLDLGTLSEQRLPFTTDICCFSKTRDALAVTVKTNPGAPADGSDPFQLGAPVRASDAECRDLEQRWSIGEVRCAYRVPVTLRPVAPDGKTPWELGIFRREVEFACAEAGIEPLQMTVTGRIEGPVKVGEGEREGMILFGAFRAGQGAQQHIVLQSDVKGLDLEVDVGRLPPFLAVPQLSPPEVASTGHRTWRLRVTVPPDKAAGHFPDSRLPGYGDSAIYLKTKEPTPRTIRIPVAGTANLG